jgi:hypothetical protein
LLAFFLHAPTVLFPALAHGLGSLPAVLERFPKKPGKTAAGKFRGNPAYLGALCLSSLIPPVGLFNLALFSWSFFLKFFNLLLLIYPFAGSRPNRTATTATTASTDTAGKTSLRSGLLFEFR